MDYEKVEMFYANPSRVSQTNCMVPSRLPPDTLQAAINHHPPSIKIEQEVSTNTYHGASTSSPSLSLELAPTVDPFSTYADNFDLSLLPQDCTPPTENIPTIVYQYTCNAPTITSTTSSSMRSIRVETTKTNETPTPQIKIEQSWSYGSALSLPEEIKREQLSAPVPVPLPSSQLQTHPFNERLKSSNQLVPPPPYPSTYPSPQSSPSQSEYGFPHSLSQFAGCCDSINSSRSSLYPSSPYATPEPSIIKQELHILPPSPPESNCEAPSPHSTWPDIKSEPIDADVETLIDLNALLDKKDFNTQYSNRSHYNSTSSNSNNNNSTINSLLTSMPSKELQQQQQQQANDQQLLREFLEDSICPMSCSMEEVHGNIEQVISMALEDTKSQAVEICTKLQISQDPSDWSTLQVHAWLRSTIAQFKLPEIEDLESKFSENGVALILLSEEDFKQRAPQSGSDLYAQLEVWRYHFAPDSDDEDEMLPTTSATIVASTGAGAVGVAGVAGIGVATEKRESGAVELKQRSGRSGGSHIHLWQFLKELLAEPHAHGTAIRWIDRTRGIFKIEDSVRVAKLWGGRKNRPAMNYDKLSRSIRQYYKKGIMKKTERSQRLVYQFCHPYQL